MKKLFLPIAALMAFSGFAKTNDKVRTKDVVSNVLSEAESKISKDDVWFCYLATTDTSPPDMAGDTTTTETYHCTWYDL